MYHNSQILSSTKYIMLFGQNRNIKEFTELKNLPLIEGLCNYVCWDISELNIYIYIIYAYNIYKKYTYESACNAGDTSLIPGSERSLGEENGCISSVQFSTCHVRLFATPWTAAHQASLSITYSQSLLKLISIESVMPSNHLILCHPLLLLPSIFPSIRVFSNESVCIRWPKYWSFGFSISPFNEHPGLISFRMDWLDLLAVQGTLKSFLQHLSSKASILQRWAFFTVQLSHPYMTTGKTIALTRWIFVGKVMCLLFNMLSRYVIAFLPRSKCLLISWLKSPSAVILETPKNKVSHCFHCFHIYFPWGDGTRCHDLSFLNVEL